MVYLLILTNIVTAFMIIIVLQASEEHYKNIREQLETLKPWEFKN